VIARGARRNQPGWQRRPYGPNCRRWIAQRTTENALSAFFPGPFDDFQEPGPAAVVPELFKGINDKLEKAAYFSDVPNLFAFAYSVPLPEPALAAVLRILSKPVDEPIINNAETLFVLDLLAYIAGAARSESISAAVINRCLYAASKAQSSDDFATLFSISVKACGAYKCPAKYREVLSATAAQLCFARAIMRTRTNARFSRT
jgi:hypothetical protein